MGGEGGGGRECEGGVGGQCHGHTLTCGKGDLELRAEQVPEMSVIVSLASRLMAC